MFILGPGVKDFLLTQGHMTSYILMPSSVCTKTSKHLIHSKVQCDEFFEKKILPADISCYVTGVNLKIYSWKWTESYALRVQL